MALRGGTGSKKGREHAMDVLDSGDKPTGGAAVPLRSPVTKGMWSAR